MQLTRSIDLCTNTSHPKDAPPLKQKKNDTIDCKYEILVSYNFTEIQKINTVTGPDRFPKNVSKSLTNTATNVVLYKHPQTTTFMALRHAVTKGKTYINVMNTLYSRI